LAATLSRPALETSRASTSLPRTPSQRRKRSTQGHGTVLDVRDAAAVVGLCHGTKAEAHASTEARKACLRPLGLTLAEAKTHVTPSPAGCPCLGDTILKNVGERGTRGPKGVRPDSASAPCRSPRRGMLAPSTPSASRQAKSAALTSVTRGGCPYDRATRHPVTTCSTFPQARCWEMAHGLGRQSKGRRPGGRRRSRIGHPCGTTTRPWVRPPAFTATRRRPPPWHPPSTEPEARRRAKCRAEDALWTGNADRPGWPDLRPDVRLPTGPPGYGCGTTRHPSAVAIEHGTPRARCTDPTEAERLTHRQPLWPACHRAQTPSALHVLSRVREKPHARCSTERVRPRAARPRAWR